jgi:hypothetical protein
LINKELVSFNDHVASPRKRCIASEKLKSPNGSGQQRNVKRKEGEVSDHSPVSNSNNETAAIESGFDLVLRSTSDAVVQYLVNGLGWRDDFVGLVTSPPQDIESPFNQIVYSMQKKRRIADEISTDVGAHSGSDFRDTVGCSVGSPTSSMPPKPSPTDCDPTTAYRTVRCGARLFELQEYIPFPSSLNKTSSAIKAPPELKRARAKKRVPSEAETDHRPARRGRPRKVLNMPYDTSLIDAYPVKSGCNISLSASLERSQDCSIPVCSGSPVCGTTVKTEI